MSTWSAISSKSKLSQPRPLHVLYLIFYSASCSTWENLAVIFVEEEHKDALKAAFGYSAVPFYIIFNAAGQVAKSGDSKAINIEQDLALASSSGAALNFDEDF